MKKPNEMKKMNVKIFLLAALSICFGFLMSCEDSSSELSSPYMVDIEGPTEVYPEQTGSYTIGDIDGAESFSWTISGPGYIVGSTTGATIEIYYSAVGEIELTVTNGDDTGTRIIDIYEVDPDVAVSLNGYGKLKEGVSDTVYLIFPAAITSIEGITMLSSTDTSYVTGSLAFSSGSLSGLTKVDDYTYYTIYTAGSGNGTPEALITKVVTTEDYGSNTWDSTYIQLYTVDNTIPIASLSYSQEEANDSTIVDITVTFTEAIDTLVVPYISFSGGGVADETDALVATSDELVYTYSYIVNGNGNGTVTIALEGITDEAGNALGGITDASVLEIDNVDPVIAFTVSGGDGVATLGVATSEAIEGMYLVLESGEDGPAEASEFGSFSGVLSGDVSFSSLTNQYPLALDPGTYDFYFLAMDESGNYSAVKSATATVN